MKVAGFTFIRNALLYDYPIKEAILSILPVCDEFVVAVGQSDDDTLGLIRSIRSDKIRIIETVWDDSLREGGKVLAVETDKAFQAISKEMDWAFYIQGDEVIHEKYLPTIVAAMKKWKDDDGVDGLLFDYLHFYGSYDYIAFTSKWYAHEIRVIKNNKSFYSYRDAQGFRKNDNEKLWVKKIDAYVYHYGWVKPPEKQQLKQQTFNKLWHDDTWVDKHVVKGESFDYTGIDALKKFEGSHPAVIQSRIDEKNWVFDFDISNNTISTKNRLKNFFKKYLGLDLNYRNYRIRR
ncbi:MAG TPA: glycosyltransferase family 2 protein [Saprospiraceae bacterium]|nr:glycosyltransferase family 2 protein [Saprospiraceae bacterium]